MEVKEEKKVSGDQEVQQQKGFKCIRTITLLIFILQSIILGAAFGQLTPIVKTITFAYGIEVKTVELSPALMQIANIFAAFPANYLVLKIGVRKSLIIGMCIVTIGEVLDCL